MNSLTTSLSDEHIIVFFKKLTSELNCSSTRKTIAQVRTILSKIKGSFSAVEMSEIFSKTPPLLHFVLLGNSRYEENKKPIKHLDELVDVLYKEDLQQSGKRLFRSEIEALGTVLIVLKRLQSLFAHAGMKVFPYVLSTEIQNAVIEEAA
jgi:hypothetical protein